jgi:glycerate 2-kinase
MISIANKDQLVANGETVLNREARALALASIEFALNYVDPKRLLRERFVLKDSTIRVDGSFFDLQKFRRVYVVGGGKASGSMAEVIEQVLGRRITDGVVAVPYADKSITEIIRLHRASHPIPDEAGVEAARRIMETVTQATQDDLIICLISGGGSSLLPLPREGISIDEKREVTQALLRCGAAITEVNTVRKHLSGIKGGWLAKVAYPATVLNLILSDVVGDRLDFIASGPTAPDPTTFGDAITVLKKHGIWDRTPEPVRKTLLDGEMGLIPETPKPSDEAFKKVTNVIIGNNRTASLAACEHLRSAGMKTLLLTSTLEGEARWIGIALASIGLEISSSGHPIGKPAGLVAGGETTVTVTGRGLGGRNQELALASALKLSGSDGVVIASASTDGIDGPTDAAGAVVDGRTLTRAKRAGLNPEKHLAENDSHNFFRGLHDLIVTGPTGTNVNDISVIVVR